jgi:CRISPR-associated protein Cmr2
MQHLLTISLGPVQEFIASARRSRDLWVGSWLLSELSKAAALKIAESQGINSLIFPSPSDKDDLAPESKFDVTNKILALIDLPPEEIEAFNSHLRETIQERLGAITADAYRHVRGDFSRDAAEAQVKDLIEYSWAAIPLPSVDVYPATRARLEALMAARKATRDFASTDKWKDAVPKSSLDGQRESVIPETAYPPRAAKPDERRAQLRRLRRDYGVRNGERLCGVGLLKRHGQRGKEERFFSTSHVAALPLINRLTEKDKQEVNAYIDVLRESLTSGELGHVPGQPHPAFERYDGHLLFEERLPEFFQEDEAALERARQALRDFLARTVGENTRPLAYYALLHADGDRMGEAIDARKSVDEHHRLSKALAEFAANVRRIVERWHSGSLVYAGGDDVLAFVPLHEVLQCAHDLAEDFKEKLRSFEITDGEVTRTPTLSVGIAVAHHLEPLSEALGMARSAEKRAKAVPGKDALAIIVSKRSGTSRIVAGKWGDIDIRLKMFVELHRADAVPDGAAYELRDLARRLKVPEKDVDFEKLQEAMRFEAVRILQRKRAQSGSVAVADQVLKVLEELILPKEGKMEADSQASISPEDVTPSINVSSTLLSIEQLADELIVARLFADAENLAQGTPDEKEES